MEGQAMSDFNDLYSYVNYLLAEHRRLHQVLHLVRQTIGSGRESNQIDWKQNVVKALRDLRAELQCHFAEEEEGACLDEAVSFQPQLSPEMKQIEQEHPRLLA